MQCHIHRGDDKDDDGWGGEGVGSRVGWGGRPVVGVGVGGVVELHRHPRVRRRLGELLGLGDGAGHPQRARRQHDGGAQRAEDAAALLGGGGAGAGAGAAVAGAPQEKEMNNNNGVLANKTKANAETAPCAHRRRRRRRPDQRHGRRHRQHAAVAAGGRHDSKPDARVAGGRLDDGDVRRALRIEDAARLGVFDLRAREQRRRRAPCDGKKADACTRQTIARAMRSFTENPGFWASSLTRTAAPFASDRVMRPRRISGVAPMDCSMVAMPGSVISMLVRWSFKKRFRRRFADTRPLRPRGPSAAGPANRNGIPRRARARRATTARREPGEALAGGSTQRRLPAPRAGALIVIPPLAGRARSAASRGRLRHITSLRSGGTPPPLLCVWLQVAESLRGAACPQSGSAAPRPRRTQPRPICDPHPVAPFSQSTQKKTPRSRSSIINLIRQMGHRKQNSRRQRQAENYIRARCC